MTTHDMTDYIIWSFNRLGLTYHDSPFLLRLFFRIPFIPISLLCYSILILIPSPSPPTILSVSLVYLTLLAHIRL